MVITEKNKNPIISVFCHRYLCLLKGFSILSVRNAKLTDVWNGIVWQISKNGDYREKQEPNYISILPPVFVFIKTCSIWSTWNAILSDVWNGTVWLVSKNGDYREKQEPNYISVLPSVLVFIKSILIFFCQICLLDVWNGLVSSL